MSDNSCSTFLAKLVEFFSMPKMPFIAWLYGAIEPYNSWMRYAAMVVLDLLLTQLMLSLTVCCSA